MKLYSGDRPLDLFVQKLPENIRLMESRLMEIESVFSDAGIENFMRLPDSTDACRKFAKLFVEFNDALEAAKVQGFTWEQREYVIRQDDGDEIRLESPLDERTYLVLAQRYKELFTKPGEPGGNFEAPYDLKGYLTEIDTGLIDADYMNANFRKWLKALDEDDSQIAAATEALHRSFATLSQEEQRFAELFLHDVERGDVAVEEGRTLRDYITAYANKEKNGQIDKLIDAFGLDGDLLREMMRLDLNEANLNEYARFDKLKASIDKDKAADFFTADNYIVSRFTVNMLANKLVREFVLEGGFDIDEWWIGQIEKKD